MTEKKDIISFKYHPNLYNNDVLKRSIGVCDCCGQKVEEYVESMYCKEKVKCICLQCISSGKAAKKFDGTFVQDAMPLDDTEKKEELFCRTPGYISWQGEYWLTCCNDYCAFVDNVGTKELEEYGIADEVIKEYEGRNEYTDIREKLKKDGSLCGYLFRCLHCGKYHLWVDAD